MNTFQSCHGENLTLLWWHEDRTSRSSGDTQTRFHDPERSHDCADTQAQFTDAVADRRLLRPLMALNCCYRGRRGAQKWYVSACSAQMWYVVVCFFILSISASVAIKQLLQIGNTHEDTVRRQRCCLSRASGVVVVVSRSQWCSDRCALGCSAAVAFGCVSLSHVSGDVG